MGNTFQDKAIDLVYAYVKEKYLDEAIRPLPEVEVYLIWFSKAGVNWKAFLGTTLDDNAYFEVTFISEMNTTYINAYNKFDTRAIKM